MCRRCQGTLAKFGSTHGHCLSNAVPVDRSSHSIGDVYDELERQVDAACTSPPPSPPLPPPPSSPPPPNVMLASALAAPPPSRISATPRPPPPGDAPVREEALYISVRGANEVGRCEASAISRRACLTAPCFVDLMYRAGYLLQFGQEATLRSQSCSRNIRQRRCGSLTEQAAFDERIRLQDARRPVPMSMSTFPYSDSCLFTPGHLRQHRSTAAVGPFTAASAVADIHVPTPRRLRRGSLVQARRES